MEPEAKMIPVSTPETSFRDEREELDRLNMRQEIDIQNFYRTINLVSQAYGGLPQNTPQPVKRAARRIALMTAAKIDPQYAEILKNAGFGI